MITKRIIEAAEEMLKVSVSLIEIAEWKVGRGTDIKGAKFLYGKAEQIRRQAEGLLTGRDEEREMGIRDIFQEGKEKTKRNYETMGDIIGKAPVTIVTEASKTRGRKMYLSTAQDLMACIDAEIWVIDSEGDAWKVKRDAETSGRGFSDAQKKKLYEKALAKIGHVEEGGAEEWV